MWTAQDVQAAVIRMHNRWRSERARRIKAEAERDELRDALHRYRSELLANKLVSMCDVRASEGMHAMHQQTLPMV